MAELKSQRVNLRMRARDDALFRRAAAAAEETLSEFLVESGRERAERLLADRTRFALPAEQWMAFVAVLDRPPHADPAIVDLLRRSLPD